MSAATQPRAKEYSAPKSAPRSFNSARPAPKPMSEAPILFQTFFQSLGTRTYAAQVKEAGNGNHFIVLTEGRREKDSDEVRKTRLLVFSEDFAEFFDLVQRTKQFIEAHPLPEEFQRNRQKLWEKRRQEAPTAGKQQATDWKRAVSSSPNQQRTPAAGSARRGQ
jgi:hypothetical protein